MTQKFQKLSCILTKRVSLARYVAERDAPFHALDGDAAEIVLTESVLQPIAPQIAKLRFFQHADHHVVAVGPHYPANPLGLPAETGGTGQKILNGKEIIFQLNERKRRKFLRGYERARRQRMILAHIKHKIRIQKRCECQLAPVDQITEYRTFRIRNEKETQIVLIGRKKRDHLFNTALRKLQIKIGRCLIATGMLVVKGRQHYRHIAAVVGQHSQGMFTLLGSHRAKQLSVTQRVLSITIDPRARFRQLHAVGPAPEQTRVQFLLQFTDDHTHMGLCGIKLLGCCCQRSTTGAGNKI